MIWGSLVVRVKSRGTNIYTVIGAVNKIKAIQTIEAVIQSQLTALAVVGAGFTNSIDAPIPIVTCGHTLSVHKETPRNAGGALSPTCAFVAGRNTRRALPFRIIPIGIDRAGR